MKRLWSKQIKGKERVGLAGGKSANLCFWKQTNSAKPAGIRVSSGVPRQKDLRIDDRGEKRTDRTVVKRERKKYRKSRKTKEARKIKDWKRYRGLWEDVTIK